MIECMRNAAREHMTLDEQISFCEEKSKNIKLKAEPQTFIDIKNSLEKLKELREVEKMSDNQSNLTDKKMEDLKNIVTDTLANVCAMADKHNIDRDSMLKYFADMLTALTEVASIQNYETNHTCNCKHNSNSRDNEPCCRCDSRQTNADRIRNMSDEELAEYLPCPHMVNWEKGNYDTCVHPNGKDGCKKCILNWLQSEVE